MTDKEGTEILDHEQSENSNNLNVCPDSITNESSGSSCETKTLSKRAQKRKDRCQKLKILQKEKKKQKRENNPPGDLNFNDDCLNETEYYIENGLRKVYPYYFTFKTHAKGRWVGRSILDVCLEEFRYTSPAGYKNHMSSGTSLWSIPSQFYHLYTRKRLWLQKLTINSPLRSFNVGCTYFCKE